MVFHPKKGLIALDIDGTLTTKTQGLDIEVLEFLTHLEKEGWGFIFITGRPFQWGANTLAALSFPYALGVQNGAVLIEMPSKKILIRNYLSHTIFPLLNKVSQEQKTDCVVYSGLENEDWCYYRPAYLPADILSYVLQRTECLGEKWKKLDNFADLPVSLFSSVKFFAKQEQAWILSQKIEELVGLHAPPNRDPFNSDYFVIQATHAQANKGHVLEEFIRLNQYVGPVIVAGDDYNDRSMLQMANLKIVMATAPADLIEMADIIAPSANQKGIIQGLTEAIYCLTHSTYSTSKLEIK